MAFVSVSGAKSSSEKPRYDLIYRGFLRRLAERMGYGAAKHGENNYQQGAGDAVYRRDRINHLIEHALKYAEGDTATDHLAAVAANANILAYLDEHKPDVLDERKPKVGERLPDLGAAFGDSVAFTNNEQPPQLNVSKHGPNVATFTRICSCAQGDGDTGEAHVGGEPV